MKIEPTRIEIPLGIMFQTVNCYLIAGEQLTLVDCGLNSEENWKIFQKNITEHGYLVEDIQQVIITHEHRDHIGLLPKIMANSNAIIRAPKSIKGWFAHPQKMKDLQGAFNENLFSSLGFPEKILTQIAQYIEFEKIGFKDEKMEMDRFHFFEAGDFLKIGSTDWEVLNTPGHSLTQYVFLQKEEKRIFGSDMLLPIAPMPIVMPDPKQNGIPTKSLSALLNSFQRLKTFDIQTVYPGHGSIFFDANKMIDKQLSRIQMRKEECFEAIKEGYVTPYQINRKMYPYQQVPPDFSGMFMILGYVDLLLEEGRISKSFDKNDFITFQLRD